jgi:hypothetical protein
MAAFFEIGIAAPAGKLAIQARLNKIYSAATKNAIAVIISLCGLMMEGTTDFESMEEKRGSLFSRNCWACRLPARKKRSGYILRT